MCAPMVPPACVVSQGDKTMLRREGGCTYPDNGNFLNGVGEARGLVSGVWHFGVMVRRQGLVGCFWLG